MYVLLLLFELEPYWKYSCSSHWKTDMWM